MNIKSSLLLARLLKYDLREGIARRIHWFIPIVLLACLSGITTATHANTYYLYNNTSGALTFVDFLIVFSKGSLPYSFASNLPFELPALWITNNFYIVFLTSYYPFRLFTGYGSILLVKATSRTLWWRSKCLYILSSVILCYTLQYLSLFLFAPNFSSAFTPSTNILTEIFNIPSSVFADSDLLLYIIFLPVLVSLALSLFQLILSLIFKPIYSYIFVLLYLGASAYIYSPLFVGNASMLLRSELSIPNGIQLLPSICMLCLLCVSIIALGERLFKRYDAI